jgi:hypothetical protein
MKLGFLVVYLLRDENEKLLDLHLNQIAACTEVPYTIYAAVNRLQDRFRSKLLLSNVKIVDIPTTALRGIEEHSYYLDHLAAAAVAGGVTHVCTLHVDSFPIRRGWSSDLAAKLRGDCVLVATMRDAASRYPVTSLMMFPREFYLQHRPVFSTPKEVRDLPEYRRYEEASGCGPRPDSGAGYGFTIFSRNLSWTPMTRTDRVPAGFGFGVFDDAIFHLGAAVWWPESREAVETTGTVKMLALARLPRRAIASVFPATIAAKITSEAAAWRREKRRRDLLANPEAFLRSIRK